MAVNYTPGNPQPDISQKDSHQRQVALAIPKSDGSSMQLAEEPMNWISIQIVRSSFECHW